MGIDAWQIGGRTVDVQPSETSEERAGTLAPADDTAGRLTELRTSAKGWHGVQLAVLGFIGLCGVLQDAPAGAPRFLQVLAGTLVLLSLVLACVATALVATAAWPVYDAGPSASRGGGEELHRTAHRLRLGIALTFLAVVVLATATTSSWWPEGGGDSASVELTTNRGSACGQLQEGDARSVALDTADGLVVVPVDQVVRLRPVSGC